MKQLIALCLFAILFASCSNPTDDANLVHDELIPLKVGNYWIYENKDYAKSNQDSLFNQYIDTLYVESQVMDGSRKLYKLRDNFTYSSESDGLWIYFINGNVTMDKSLFFKFPSKVGDINYIKPLKTQVNTISTNEIVKIDLGEFSCYKYQLLNGFDNRFDYFAPNIGMIKAINTHFSSELQDSVVSHYTLISYHLE